MVLYLCIFVSAKIELSVLPEALSASDSGTKVAGGSGMKRNICYGAKNFFMRSCTDDPPHVLTCSITELPNRLSFVFSSGFPVGVKVRRVRRDGEETGERLEGPEEWQMGRSESLSSLKRWAMDRNEGLSGLKRWTMDRSEGLNSLKRWTMNRSESLISLKRWAMSRSESSAGRRKEMADTKDRGVKMPGRR